MMVDDIWRLENYDGTYFSSVNSLGGHSYDQHIIEQKSGVLVCSNFWMSTEYKILDEINNNNNNNTLFSLSYRNLSMFHCHI